MAQTDRRNEYIYINLMKKSSHIYLTQLGRTLPVKDYYEKKHGLSRYLFDYIICGRGYVVYDGKKYDVGAGDMIFMRKGIDVEYGTDPVDLYRKIWFAVDGEAVGVLTDCYLRGKDIVIKKNGDMELFLKLSNIVSTSGCDERLITHAIIDILMSLAKLTESGGAEADDRHALGPRIKNYIDNRINERLSLDDLAEHFHISKRHIIRVFKENYNKTPGAYHGEQRLIAAAHYLTETAYTIGAIAALLGYCDQSFFSTAFKKHFGIYPLAYRSGGYSSITLPSPNE